MRSLLTYATFAIGCYITAQVMTFTKGFVGILHSSSRLKMPQKISEMPGLLPPVLTLVYNCTLIMRDTAQVLEDNCKRVNLDPFKNSGYFFPDSFLPESKTNKTTVDPTDSLNVEGLTVSENNLDLKKNYD